MEQLRKEKQEAEAALALSRQELRQLSAAGSANPNFPAGMHRGATNKSLNPPLFKTVRASIQTPSGLNALQTDPFLVIWLRDRVSLPLRRRSCWEGRVAATLQAALVRDEDLPSRSERLAQVRSLVTQAPPGAMQLPPAWSRGRTRYCFR